MRTLAALVVAAAVCLAACQAPHSQSGASPGGNGGAAASSPSSSSASGANLPSIPSPQHPAALAAQIERADERIVNPSSTPNAVRAASEFEQLAARTLANVSTAVERRVTSALSGRTAAVMTADLDAASSLGALTTPEPTLPTNWRVVQPLPAPVLVRLYHAAARRTGVPWEYLAAINFVETKFGRVVGPSTAGAQGPMQFMPTTWAEYGAGGNVHDPRAAIPAAARMLADFGAPGDMASALRAYNDSSSYVLAVTAYASVMRRWPRELLGYWNWQVLFRQRAGTFVLPVGYPRTSASKLPGP